jgi:hypothetical protein
MRNAISARLLTVALFFTLFSFLRGWFEVPFLGFWVGGLIGILLPFSDYAIFAYFIKPDSGLSVNFKHFIGRKNIFRAFDVMLGEESVRKELIIHTAFFQLFFVFLALLVATSSGNLFGRGLVLGFLIELVVAQYEDYKKRGNIDLWFDQFKVKPDAQKQKYYLIANLLAIAALGLYF